MRKNRLLAGLIVSLLIYGCSPRNPDTEVAEAFWRAVQAQDAEAILALSSDPEEGKVFSSGFFQTAFKHLEVLSNGPDGVEVRFMFDCYPDVVAMTKMSGRDGARKVDVAASIKAHIAQSAGQKHAPTKKYCYEFSNQALQGKLDGSAWVFKQAHRMTVEMGTVTHEFISLTAESFENGNFIPSSTPFLSVGTLDWNGDGGNLDSERSVTINSKGKLFMVSDGSYRIARLQNGTTRLEISFYLDESNHLNGYVDL